MNRPTPLARAYARFRAIFVTTIVFSFSVNALLFVGPLYMLQIYDRVLASRNETTLVMITLIAVGLLIAYGSLEYLRSRMLVRAGMEFDEALAAPLFNRVVKMKLANQGSGAEAVLTDIDKLREFLTGHGLLAFFDAPWVPLFLVLCFLFHPILGFVATAGAVLIFALALANELLTRQALRKAAQAGQGANQFAGAALQNVEVIRALGMEEQLGARWRERHTAMLNEQAVASDRAGVIMSSTKFIRSSLQVFILGAGAYLALKQEITPGIMIAASIIMGRALAPVEQAVGQWRQFVGARQAHKRLMQLFKDIPEDEERTELPAPTGRVTIEQLSSVIPGTRVPMLKNVSFEIQPGETLAIIGPSGSGKSTLLRHLVGVSPTLAGHVRLDGADLGHWEPDQLGRFLGYLPQDVKLFSGTVAENISRFKEGESADVVAAAQLAGTHDMIQRLTNGYETQMGDGGHQLSGGQRQRIGLARALYGNPVFVILDEPNSNLDSEGELALMEALRRLKERQVTVVIVTHKPSVLALSDKVLLLKDGAVQSFGPAHNFLNANPGIVPLRHPTAVPVPRTA